ncbi:MAG: GNAT family N-acetyltransferase [Clostridia bacterium]|nr:GNAT family N-acetyltransferase [Clostridia bacterium]
MEGKIKEVGSFEDFRNVYRVFSGPPYNEKYTDEELGKIFREYQEGGYIFGAYSDDVCAGIVALERGAKTEQPVKFEEESIMYLADVAVLDEYRNTGLGTQLMIYAVMQSSALGYQRLYMRTLERGKSMSYGIAYKIGFRQIPGVFQDVERERVNGSIETARNIFLDIDLRNLNRDALKRGIQEACARQKPEEER